MKNGFTWDYVRDQPLPPRPAPYIAKQITPCSTGKQAEKATALASVNTFKSVAESWTVEV